MRDMVISTNTKKPMNTPCGQRKENEFDTIMKDEINEKRRSTELFNPRIYWRSEAGENSEWSNYRTFMNGWQNRSEEE